MKNKSEFITKFIPNIQDYNVITDEKADFIHEHAKEYLLQTIKTHEVLQNKVVLLFVDQDLRFIKISETINYQAAIDINIEEIKKISHILKYSIIGLFVLPFILRIVFYFMLNKLSNFFSSLPGLLTTILEIGLF